MCSGHWDSAAGFTGMEGVAVLNVPFSFSVIVVIHFQTYTHVACFNIQTPESINFLAERKFLCYLANSKSTEKVRLLLKKET